MSPTPLPTAEAAVKRAVEEAYTTTAKVLLPAYQADVVLHCIPGGACTGSYEYPVNVREDPHIGENFNSGSFIMSTIGLYLFFVFAMFIVGICGMACTMACVAACGERSEADDVEKQAPRAKPKRKRRNSDFVDAFLRGVAKAN